MILVVVQDLQHQEQVRAKMQLTEPEALELHRQYKKLEGKELARHLNTCMEKFKYIVMGHAKPYKRFSNYQDLIQEGLESMFMAFENYDETKGNIFYWIHSSIFGFFTFCLYKSNLFQDQADL
jgi:DNA-directed RNA polymerase specialized sigma subunit